MNSRDLINKIKKKFIVKGNEKCQYTKKGFERFVEEIILDTLKICKWEKLKAKLNKASKLCNDLKKKLEEKNGK